MLDEWNQEEIALAWSKAVGQSGDIYQRTILKPYITACVVARYEDQPAGASKIFHDILADAMSNLRRKPNPTSVDDISDEVEAQCNLRLQPISNLKILDIGAGEGFLGRWLEKHCDLFVLVEPSESLLDKSKVKSPQPSKVLRRYKGDFGNLEEHSSFFQWLSVGCERKGDEPPILESECGFDFVICTNVIDHIELPIPGLKALAKFCQNSAESPIIIMSSLNPEFFLGAGFVQDVSIDKMKSPDLKKVKMGPSGEDVTVYPRSWMQTETILHASQLSILTCDPIDLSQFNGTLQHEYIRQRGFEHYPGAGPFVLWTLKSGIQGSVLSPQEVEKTIITFKSLSALSSSQRNYIKSNPGHLSRISYKPNEMIAYPSNLPFGFCLVEKGTAVMGGVDGRQQVFSTGSEFGELETGNDPFVSRYLYPIFAGETGCTIIRIHKKLLNELLEQDELSGLGSALYSLLRDRVSTFSWIYQRTTPASQDAKNIVTHIGDRRTGVNDRTCESLARVLLFASTMEGGIYRKLIGNSAETSGLAMLISPEEMKSIVNGEPQTNKKNTPYKSAIELFHKLGIIDAFSVVDYVSEKSQEARSGSFIRVVESGMRHLVLDKLFKVYPKLVDQNTSFERRIIHKRPGVYFPEWPVSWESIYDLDVSLARNNMQSLNLTKTAKNFIRDAAQFAKKARDNEGNLIFSGSHVYDQQILDGLFADLVVNLAFCELWFYKKQAPLFFVIKDLFFLRKIATSAEGWVDELYSRATHSPQTVIKEIVSGKNSGSKGIRIATSNTGVDEDWRFFSYLKHFEEFVFQYWKNEIPLKLTHESFFEKEGHIERWSPY